ncbi:hypothetical protein [Tropicibacter sp. Alg240-R139]|uniref:hypothetical protein n=1 Tax=Tropicibacter sp. Alg240-R139 TaxID=2305991 RepID=UPI0013DEDBD0|nr:hypothetical protein [Tropicibacter sp. Alg240-R139]
MRNLIAVAVSALVTFSAAHAEAPDITLKGSIVVLFSDPPLTREQKMDAKRFRTKDYFAAMAVNTVQTDIEYTGAAWGYHNIEVAKDVALKSCRFKAQNPSDCVLLLAVVPKNFDLASRSFTVSEYSQKAFVHASKLSRKKPNKFIAFAIDNNHMFAYSRFSKTRDKAEQHALELCKEGAKKQRVKMPEDWNQAVLGPKHLECRVIHVFGPTGSS